MTVAALTVDRCCGQVSSGGAETRHVKPVTIRTMAGAAAQQCLDALREGDAIARCAKPPQRNSTTSLRTFPHSSHFAAFPQH